MVIISTNLLLQFYGIFTYPFGSGIPGPSVMSSAPIKIGKTMIKLIYMLVTDDTSNIVELFKHAMCSSYYRLYEHYLLNATRSTKFDRS